MTQTLHIKPAKQAYPEGFPELGALANDVHGLPYMPTLVGQAAAVRTQCMLMKSSLAVDFPQTSF